MTEEIIVKKVNAGFVYLASADQGIIHEICEFFTFFAEGYKFAPSYRNKLWDGKIRIVNYRDQRLPTGLLPHLSKFTQSRGYKLTIDPTIFSPTAPSVELLQEFADRLPLTAKGQNIKLRDYQFKGFTIAARNQKCLIISSTGSGKSLMMYVMMRWFLTINQGEANKCLIVVPSISLVSQLKKDFTDYSSTDKNFDGENEIHEIYSGKEKLNLKQRVVITTWQSAIGLPKSWFLDYGMVIGDEAHTFKAKSLNTIMGNLVNAEYRIGTTGTTDGVNCHELILQGHFGPKQKVITTAELIEKGTLADLEIKCMILKYPDEFRKIYSKYEYQKEIDFIVAEHRRNRFITKLVAGQKGNTLVLFNLVNKHGKPLYDLIKTELKGTGREVYFVSGEVKVDERERIRNLTEKGDGCVIVASMGTFAVGIDIRNLHNIIFASPSKSLIKVLQSIGRGLRKADNGQGTVVFDLTDDLSWKKKQNYTLRHGIERAKIYAKEKFKFNTYNIDLYD